MKLTVEGNISGEVNKTYYQNLCLIFFPGAKFPQSEDVTDETDTVYFEINEENGEMTCNVTAKNGKRGEYHGWGRVKVSEYVTRVRAIKTVAGDAMLEAGEKMLGKRPPWGIMTGVRPAKIGRELRARGFSGEDFENQLIKDFHVSPEKAHLLEKITRVEERAVCRKWFLNIS